MWFIKHDKLTRMNKELKCVFVLLKKMKDYSFRRRKGFVIEYLPDILIVLLASRKWTLRGKKCHWICLMKQGEGLFTFLSVGWRVWSGCSLHLSDVWSGWSGSPAAAERPRYGLVASQPVRALDLALTWWPQNEEPQRQFSAHLT